MAAEVWYLELAADWREADLARDLARLAGKLGLPRGASGAGPWLLKIQLGDQRSAAALTAGRVAAVARGLHLAGRLVACDTLSIQQAGLATVADQLALARQRGFGRAGEIDYQVADAGDSPGDRPDRSEHSGDAAEITVSGLAAAAAGLCILNQVRPHPHLGLRGALAALGLELVDRPTKLRLHAPLRPRVETALCGGCGSCLNVCIWDAIKIKGGRAVIDPQLCTGCGECMNACFLAGIQPQQAAAVPVFQKRAAEAARAVAAGKRGNLAFFNFLLGGRPGPQPARAGRTRLGDRGVLASLDPVALDRATWDLICREVGGPLASWSGFAADPATLLAAGRELGLGGDSYRLRPLA